MGLAESADASFSCLASASRFSSVLVSTVQPNTGAACCRRSSCAITQADLMRSVRGPDSSLVWKSALLPLFPGLTCRPAMR